jgi:hypothetical protein
LPKCGTVNHGEEELALAGRGVGAGQLAGEDLDADAALVEVIGDREYVLDGAVEPVKLPDDEGVTVAQVVQRSGEARAVADGLAGADLFLVDPADPGSLQGVALELALRSRTCPRPPSSWVIDHDCGS